MLMLAAAGLTFIAIHLLISGTRIRDSLTGAIGEGPYLGLFSLASLATIAWLAMSYNAAQKSAADPVLYDLGGSIRDLGIPIIAVAFLLGVQGLMMPNPTAVRQGTSAAKEENIRGVLRITRHPFLWGVILWSGFHLLANGDLASVQFFGSLFVVALAGTFSIDAKRARKLGPAWEVFAAKTSNVPFRAVLEERNSLNLGESFGWSFWVAAAVFLAVLMAHPYLFHASPFPGGWMPF
jgi:uncharacterized membrane protein